MVSNAAAIGRHGAARTLRVGRVAEQHLLAAAPAGDQADADLDQAHVGFGMRLDVVAVQQDLAAAAERHPRRRADHRERRVLERLVDLLAPLDDLLDLGPHRDVHGEQDQPEVGADREVVGLVVDDQRLPGPPAVADQVDRAREQRHDVGVERVHLAGELQAQHAVADVPQRRRTVLRDRLGARA